MTHICRYGDAGAATNCGGKHTPVFCIRQGELIDQLLISVDRRLVDIFVHQPACSRQLRERRVWPVAKRRQSIPGGRDPTSVPGKDHAGKIYRISSSPNVGKTPVASDKVLLLPGGLTSDRGCSLFVPERRAPRHASRRLFAVQGRSHQRPARTTWLWAVRPSRRRAGGTRLSAWTIAMAHGSLRTDPEMPSTKMKRRR
jgi:hypothetical protein